MRMDSGQLWGPAPAAGAADALPGADDTAAAAAGRTWVWTGACEVLLALDDPDAPQLA